MFSYNIIISIIILLQGWARNRPLLSRVLHTCGSPVFQTSSQFFPSPRSNVASRWSGFRSYSFGAVYLVLRGNIFFLFWLQHWNGGRGDRRGWTQHWNQLVLVILGRSIWCSPLGCFSPSKLPRIAIYSSSEVVRLWAKLLDVWRLRSLLRSNEHRAPSQPSRSNM